jgi:hypothetical protein
VHLVLALEQRGLALDHLLERRDPGAGVAGQPVGDSCRERCRCQGLCVSRPIVVNNDHPVTVDPSLASPYAVLRRIAPRERVARGPSGCGLGAHVGAGGRGAAAGRRARGARAGPVPRGGPAGAARHHVGCRAARDPHCASPCARAGFRWLGLVAGATWSRSVAAGSCCRGSRSRLPAPGVPPECARSLGVECGSGGSGSHFRTQLLRWRRAAGGSRTASEPFSPPSPAVSAEVVVPGRAT